uniref:Uncharacterized protein n=1 Tax=Timema poppense TaxID=170557 RepID=A0A7R9CSU4_TIMPO|nr:unnamed protein product [Timema poppensis]
MKHGLHKARSKSEYTLTLNSAQCSRSSYKCARASKWGDLLPIKVESVNGSQETNADKIDSGSQETNPEKMDSEQKDS